MGIVWYAISAIGYRIDARLLYTTETIIHDEHKVPEGARLCPECGVPASYTETVPIPGLDEDKMEFRGFPVVFSRGEAHAILCVHKSQVSSYESPSRVTHRLTPRVWVELEKKKDELLSMMIQLNLAREAVYGLHTILSASY